MVSGILKSYWTEALPEGPWLFPEDQLSDLSERLLAAEITREEIFHRLHELSCPMQFGDVPKPNHGKSLKTVV